MRAPRLVDRYLDAVAGAVHALGTDPPGDGCLEAEVLLQRAHRAREVYRACEQGPMSHEQRRLITTTSVFLARMRVEQGRRTACLGTLAADIWESFGPSRKLRDKEYRRKLHQRSSRSRPAAPEPNVISSA